MAQTISERVVEEVLNELLCRGGFDAWWYSIDEDVREGLVFALEERVESVTG